MAWCERHATQQSHTRRPAVSGQVPSGLGPGLSCEWVENFEATHVSQARSHNRILKLGPASQNCPAHFFKSGRRNSLNLLDRVKEMVCRTALLLFQSPTSDVWQTWKTKARTRIFAAQKIGAGCCPPEQHCRQLTPVSINLFIVIPERGAWAVNRRRSKPLYLTLATRSSGELWTLKTSCFRKSSKSSCPLSKAPSQPNVRATRSLFCARHHTNARSRADGQLAGREHKVEKSNEVPR